MFLDLMKIFQTLLSAAKEYRSTHYVLLKLNLNFVLLSDTFGHYFAGFGLGQAGDGGTASAHRLGPFGRLLPRLIAGSDALRHRAHGKGAGLCGAHQSQPDFPHKGHAGGRQHGLRGAQSESGVCARQLDNGFA